MNTSDETGERLLEGGREDNPLIVIASNRGPFSFSVKANGDLETKRGSGGLVTALGALAERHDVLWVAAALGKGDQRWMEQTEGRTTEVEGIRLRLVQPSRRRYEQYYNVIANPLLWFIQHQLYDIPRKPIITRET